MICAEEYSLDIDDRSRHQFWMLYSVNVALSCVFQVKRNRLVKIAKCIGSSFPKA